MKASDTFGLLAAAMILLVAAGITQSYHTWSVLGNSTVPWFCSTLALAILLVTLTALLSGCVPNAIPRSRVLAVLFVSSSVVGLGMVVDYFSYTLVGDWAASLGEWLGFTLMLGGVFWIPRFQRGHTDGDQPGS